ncbi:MAG: macro domain-containing protein [Promethearchaeota archaeon]
MKILAMKIYNMDPKEDFNNDKYAEASKSYLAALKKEYNEFKGYFLNKSKLNIQVGDVTQNQTDVIVSSDDTYLSIGGGVSASIFMASGKNLHQIAEERSKYTPAKLGDVIVTSAGRLHAKYIFHVITLASSSYREETNKSSIEIVFDGICKCFQLMSALGLKSIAFPVIGTGTAAFDYEKTLTIMVSIIAHLLEKNSDPLEATINLFGFEDKISDLSVLLNEIDNNLNSYNTKLLTKSIELVSQASSSIQSSIRSLILKSKLNLLEGEIVQANKNLEKALKLAEDNHLAPLVREINYEIKKLTKEFREWSEKIEKNTQLKEMVDSLELTKYIQIAQALTERHEESFS